MVNTSVFGVISIVILVILYIYAFVGSLFEAKHFHLLHESGFGILLGTFAGLLFYYISPSTLISLTHFDQELFFYLLLPIIIFSGGYNLNKRRFFQNFFYISLYGIIGTVITFVFIVVFTLYVNNMGWITASGDGKTVTLNIQQIMIFGATLCASDSVAALSMIKADKYPKLFSIVFGEGMINDAVSIIIFQSVGKLTNVAGTEFCTNINNIYLTVEFQWATPFVLIGEFLYEFICSALIGISLALFATWMFKTFRFLTHSSMIETMMILYLGYASFNLCYMVDLSGVLSAMVSGIVLAHYNFYNVSPIGKVASQVTIQSISNICESFIYLYLGISVWSIKGIDGNVSTASSWTFVLQELLIIFIARALTMVLLSYICIFCMGRGKWRLRLSEVSIIWFTGLVRGSVAYALIQSLYYNSPEQQQQVEIIQTTVLMLVIITTVILGGLMPFYIVLNLNAGSKKNIPTRETIRESLVGSIDIGQGESEPSRQYRSSFQLWVKRIDEKFLKPFFIFQYEQRKNEINKAKKLLRMNNADFDPQKVGRVTFLNAPSIHSKSASNILLNRLTDQNKNSLLQEPEGTKPVFTRITLQGVMNSKYSGTQNFGLEFDVPIFVENIHEEDNSDPLLENSGTIQELPEEFNQD